MDLKSYLYRECSKGDSFVGNIQLFCLHGHRMYLQIEGLQQNEYWDSWGGQADVVVQVDPHIAMYRAIHIVLDKIVEDFQYRMRYPIEDYIVVSEAFATAHPNEIHRDEQYHAPQLALTESNFIYVDIWEDHEVMNDRDEPIIRGHVDADSHFIYDYPIVSRGVPREYYERTRGICVRTLEEEEWRKEDKHEHDFIESLSRTIETK